MFLTEDTLDSFAKKLRCVVKRCDDTDDYLIHPRKLAAHAKRQKGAESSPIWCDVVERGRGVC